MRFRFLLPLLLSLAMARGQEVVKTPPPVSPAVQAQADQLVQMLRDANDLLAKGNTDGALAKINAVLKVDPQSLAAYVLRGAIYSKQKQWDKAQGDYEAAHLINPHSAVVQFNLAEVHFAQKQFNQARTAFQALEADRTTDLGDLAAYKVFLCDLFAGDEAAASKELDAFNQIGSNASYYFANAAWDLYHHKTDDARSWLTSANNIYSRQKNGFYAASLFENGYLPLAPASATASAPAGSAVSATPAPAPPAAK